MNKRYYIGIDPGANTGFAIWDSKQKTFMEVSTQNFWDVIESLTMENVVPTKSTFCIVIEDPNLNRPIFAGPRRDANNMLKIAQNVGMNKRDAQLLIEWCERNGFEVIRVKPTTAKWDSKTFKAYTKWEGSTNEHGRDAAKLVFGR